MLTFGGIIYSTDQKPLVADAEFSELSFVASGKKATLIEMPNLTPKEIGHLDSMLPTNNAAKLCKSVPVPPSDAKKYAEIYRYFPSFSEIES